MKENKNINKIKSLSQKEVEIIAWLESYEKYFFSVKDIDFFFTNKKQRYNSIQRLLVKKRIIKLNKNKYFLVPIKARSGGWAENPFVIADEVMNGKNYFIGGWSAANYYRLTDQIPFWIEVYTTKRQGRKKIFNTGFIFRRTTENKIKKAVIKKLNKHEFRIMNKREMEKWMKLREYLV
ncbi:MAG: hypothetical protein Q7S74_05755 [Nanoarchaeota archaeon]|nr:hypothetical protein [Nanoarchaeota archaeon]